METTKYKVITDYVKNRIETGSLTGGDKLPSENVLTMKFNVSRDTVRRGLKQLEDEGIVEKRKGSGTFVKIKVKRNSNRIAVVTTYVENYIFPKIITGIDSVLSENGYVMQLSFTNNLFDRERIVLEDIIEKDDVAGVIMEPVKSALPNPNIDCYEKLKSKNIPIIFINSYYREIDIPHVSLNDEEMGYMATKYLLDKGHRKIGAIIKMDDGQGHHRFSGYRKAMYESGVHNASEDVVWYDTEDEKDINNLSEHIEKRLSDKTAVFCYNDRIAKDFADYCVLRGKKIPEDVSIISMDDSMIAKVSDITSCPHPLEELGKVSVGNLLKLIDNPSFNGTKEFITSVTERASVKNMG